MCERHFYIIVNYLKNNTNPFFLDCSIEEEEEAKNHRIQKRVHNEASQLRKFGVVAYRLLSGTKVSSSDFFFWIYK